MEEQIELLQAALDARHRVIKESKEFQAKREALCEAAVLTGRYLRQRYGLEGLYDYRRIERMAARLPGMVQEQLAVAERHYAGGSTWRADIALNSLGLDLYIMHTTADEIAQDSGSIPPPPGRRKLPAAALAGLRKLVKTWSGHHRRSAAQAVDEAARRTAEMLEMDPEKLDKITNH
jgi:hypothetical protein